MSISINGNGITSANIADGAITNADIADVAASKLTGALPAISGAALTNLPGGGKVLQVKQAVKTNTYTTTSSTWADITGLTVSITPTSTTSKILVSYTVQYSGAVNAYNGLALARGGSRIILGTAATGSMSPITTSASVHSAGDGKYKLLSSSFEYLDAPGTTSAQTYSIQGVSLYDARKLNINTPYQMVTDTSVYMQSGVSQITVMEIGA